MPVTWVMFNLTGTLVDPVVMAQPLGDSVPDEEMVEAALDDAIAQAMASTLTGADLPFASLIEAGLRRRLRLAGRDERGAAEALELMGTMPAYLETPRALEMLRGVGLRLAVLAQSSVAVADGVLRFAGLRDRFELVISAEESGAYKPDPRPYRLALEQTGAGPGELCHVSTYWWDVAGAKRAGLVTGWVARRERALLDSVPEPDYTGRDLVEVAEAILARMPA
ncbi:MAG: HAD family hydrolase [Solirubrobacteraceae bacterium]